MRKTLLFAFALGVVAVLWELYKWLGPARGGDVFGWSILPKTSDNAMPHTWKMVARLFDPESRSSSRPIWRVVATGVWFSLRLSLVGFAVGAGLGVALAVVMARFGVAKRGLMPYLVASQTVPLIALAPLVVSWNGKVHPFGWDIPRWVPVALLGSFLAFFPVAVGTLRGLESTPATAVELMRSYAASWGQTLRTLRFPAAVPSMVPALRIAASASVVGVVVAEISTGQRGGIGRLIIEYGRQATSDPAKVYTAVFGAAVLGLVMAGLVAAADHIIMRDRIRPEEAGT